VRIAPPWALSYNPRIRPGIPKGVGLPLAGAIFVGYDMPALCTTRTYDQASTKRCPLRTFAVALAFSLAAPAFAFAQGAAGEASADPSADPMLSVKKDEDANQGYWYKKFKGSSVTYETAVGSGTFVR